MSFSLSILIHTPTSQYYTGFPILNPQGCYSCIAKYPSTYVFCSDRKCPTPPFMSLSVDVLGMYRLLYEYIQKYREVSGLYTAKTQYRNSKQIIPEKELHGLSPNFKTFRCLWAIYIFPQSVCLFCYWKICGPILGIYKSLTDKWMWKLWLRTHNSFSGNT